MCAVIFPEDSQTWITTAPNLDCNSARWSKAPPKRPVLALLSIALLLQCCFGTMTYQRPTFTAKVTRTIMLSEPAQTKHMEFEVLELDRFDFAAGQFVSMTAPKEGKTMTRAYSIASGPRHNRQFDLCLNRVLNGFFSNLLCDMKVGDAVSFHGPHGNFVLRNPLRDSLFIATGTGIAPMRAFVEWLFGETPRHEDRE